MNKKKEYKNFDWDKTYKVSLEEFIETLVDNDWSVMDTTETEDRTVIHCERTSQIFSEPFLEN